MVSRVLVKVEDTVLSRAMLYKVVVQTVLFYGIESLVITYEMMKVLEGFNHLISRGITGKTAQSISEEGW